jgi:hypothetical protein
MHCHSEQSGESRASEGHCILQAPEGPYIYSPVIVCYSEGAKATEESPASTRHGPSTLT